jgi:ubiquinone/menaquinone biosynthesis C-methylase UbiE
MKKRLNDVNYQEEIRKLFKEDEQSHYDFSEAPTLIRVKDRNALKERILKGHDTSRWMNSQLQFLDWAKDRRVFTRGYIESGKATYDVFFEKRGSLRGKILDIGGGWGLWRQWWEPSKSDLFIVHDPGIERFLRGPHKLHRDYYQRALSMPMVFVEGFGEGLPYRDGIFDISLVAATLDHCINPQRVIDEAYRCTKPKGSIIVVQSCYSPESSGHRLSHLKSLGKCSPGQLLRIFYLRVFRPDHHLNRFRPVDVTLMLERAGFADISKDTVPNTQDVYAFEAWKPSRHHHCV